MIDLLYVASNRLRMTEASFEALRENTDWSEVATLHVADDASEDGTATYLHYEANRLERDKKVNVRVTGGPFGGPVAALNWYLDEPSEDVEVLGKVDNDFVVCPGWLGDMLKTLSLHPELDILGCEPFTGDPTMPPAERDIVSAEHIGGKGLIRLRAFSHCRPRPSGDHGYQGFTQWQVKHPNISKAWITPDLPCFGLDQLEFEPWASLTDEYVERGWQRRWPPYHEKATDYWDWWRREQ